MPDPKANDPRPVDSDSDDAQAELRRLRARVAELEAAGAPETRSSGARESQDILRDLPEKAFDEGSKFLRAVALAAIEPLRLAGDMATQLGDEVLERNRPERVRARGERPTPARVAAALPKDASEAFVRVLDRSLEMPGRMIGRLYEAYHETESLERSGTERELARARQALARAERLAGRREEKTARKP